MDKLKFVISSPGPKNKIKVHIYLPRLKWRLLGVINYSEFTGKIIKIHFNELPFNKNLIIQTRLFTNQNIGELNLVMKNEFYQFESNNDFIHEILINSLYEKIYEYIKKEGQIELKLNIKDQFIPIVRISGEKGEFHDHKKPKRRKLRANHSKRIRHSRSVLRELKLGGWTNTDGRKVISTLFTILSNELNIDRFKLVHMFLREKDFHDKINKFLIINNVKIQSGMIYEEFIGKLWEGPYEKFVEIIDCLVNRIN
jgi:hypothetical protein